MLDAPDNNAQFNRAIADAGNFVSRSVSSWQEDSRHIMVVLRLQVDLIEPLQQSFVLSNGHL